MGAFLDALTSKFLAKLSQIIQDEVAMTLSVKRDIKRLKKNLEHFGAVGEDAEALALQDRGAESWWKNMTDVMFDVDDVIDHFMVHSQKLLLPPRMECCNQSLLSFIAKLSFDHRVAKRIKDINRKLDEIQKNRNMFISLERTSSQQYQVPVVDRSQTSPIDELEVFGRDTRQATDDMVKMILSNFHEDKSTVFGIQGMGGIGKTTLAQKIYNEQRIREKFQVHIWLCVSQSYTEIGLPRQAIRMAGATCGQLETKTELLFHLMDTIRGKSVFLVLDDAWKSDVWIDLLRSPFKRCSNANILVTTRNLDVLAGMHATYTHQVNKMNDYDGLELLMKNDVGCQIVRKCDGLPLAIAVVAGVLSTKRTRAEWESIRDSNWSIHGLPKELGGPLFMSYSNLTPQLKSRNAVAYWWVAEGFVRKDHKCSIHAIAEEYYYELITRNLLQPKPEFVDKGISTMHDLLRSLGQYLTRYHSLFMNAENNEVPPNLRCLSISSSVEEIPAIGEYKCMRSLLIFNNKNFKSVNTNIFRKLEHIRVLVLSGSGILIIPESVGNLVLLRLLDLSYTEISKLPDSIGRLTSLESLSLRGCHKLDSLTVSLMRLSQISFLKLEKTAIDHVPKGIATRELGLCCTVGMNIHDKTHYQASEIEKIQQVYEMLIPSPSLLYIFFVGFPGVRFPEWLCSEPEYKLPNLSHMQLNECISCLQLPPVGQMPELLVLQIRGAGAVVTMGAEFLGRGVTKAAAVFPKLELLHIIRMRNLESWSLKTRSLCNNMETKSQQLVLMPCLKRLLLLDCPKLRALPEDLHRAVNLKRIHIEGAHKLQQVVNLPEVLWLTVKNNKSLRRISNLH
ncbi:hypothetical protein SETIT_5G103000v2 [Setaria italica]|uniref:NB-ARC domain-containing protein n=1 Tax=Setaria italica TaxID=4555 RepID=A0A368R3C2_SETIT|nr:hypothetical protein SETIT_5G103000v2 [Setaria italica]